MRHARNRQGPQSSRQRAVFAAAAARDTGRSHPSQERPWDAREEGSTPRRPATATGCMDPAGDWRLRAAREPRPAALTYDKPAGLANRGLRFAHHDVGYDERI